MLQIPLSGENGIGQFALVDSEDYPRLMRHSWYYRDGYALTKINKKEVRMHRLLLGVVDENIVVDHKDRNRLNNTKANLREFTPVQNANNRVDNRRLVAFGEEKTLAEWVEDPICRVRYSVLQKRIQKDLPFWMVLIANDE
jgi:hypothetical protein